MGFSLETSVPILTVFVQGLLSFFSPCVLPLLPLYVSYLAGSARKEERMGPTSIPAERYSSTPYSLRWASARPFSCWDWDLPP